MYSNHHHLPLALAVANKPVASGPDGSTPMWQQEISPNPILYSALMLHIQELQKPRNTAALYENFILANEIVDGKHLTDFKLFSTNGS